MKIERRFSKPGIDPLDEVRWERRESVIREPDGTVVFEMRDLEVPADWSQVATDILAQKYFRKAGVPQPDGSLGRETSARQVVRRLAGCWTDWGRRYKYFDSDEDAAAFDAEISHMLINQMAAPNSPQWFNTGLAYSYGITGPAQGHYYVDPDTRELLRAKDSYSHPQPHACLPGHALVNTPTGAIPIQDIHERDMRGLQVFDRDGVTTVVATKNTGVKLVYKVALENGRFIEATGDHLVLVADPALGRIWERVDELVPGSRLLRRFDTEAAQLLGGLKVRDAHDPLAASILPSLQELTRTALATLAAPLLHEIPVSAIEPLSEQVVFDIQTESHTFLTNNVVVHNCFIQSVEDDLVNENGIMDLWVREARLFKFGSGCVSARSFINLSDRGFVKIGDLFEELCAQRPVLEFDGKGRYVDTSDLNLKTLALDSKTGLIVEDKIDRVWSYDVAKEDKVTVRFDTGARATVSAWHPFMVWDGSSIVEKRADHLVRGDAVLGPNSSALRFLEAAGPRTVSFPVPSYHETKTHEVEADTDLAWLAGYFLGDGCLGYHHLKIKRPSKTYDYRRLRLRFFDEDPEPLEKVARILRSKFQAVTNTSQDTRGSHGLSLTCTKAAACAFFAHAIHRPGAKGDSLAIPDFVKTGGLDLKYAFLAGLIDSDGTAFEGRATYSTECKSFAGEVAALASLLGLGGGITLSGGVYSVSIIRRSTDQRRCAPVAKHLATPKHSVALEEHERSGRRAFCMPVDEALSVQLFPDEDEDDDLLHASSGSVKFHVGRLVYEGVMNPRKILDAIAAKAEQDVDAKLETLRLVAEGVAFVTQISPCEDDVAFNDLTTARTNTYLAGEAGFVVIHNTGSNFSNIRAEGEKLSGGGTSSGLMSFLRVGDRAAGAIKSGGTTRRAAKMVIVDIDHPDIQKFINWKVEEEKKVAALIAAGYESSYEGDAYNTVSGQNSNNSVRITDKFIDAVRKDDMWDLLWRRDKTVARSVRARDLWDEIGRAAWACADPGIQYDDIINSWHTCPEGGRIRASNPCVTGDTLVATADGLQRIDELVGKSAFVLGADGKPHFVSRIFKTGVKPVYVLRTKAGYELRLTADHKVLTQRGDVAARDLRVNDKVRLQGAGFGSKRLSDEVATAIGVAIGNGSSKQINSNSQLTGSVAVASRSAVEVSKRYAVVDEGENAKRFSPAIYELDKVSLAAILRELFTVEGTLDSASLTLVQQVQLLLLSFNIKAALRSEHATHSLRISGSSSLRLAELKNTVSTYRDDMLDEIESLIPAGTEDVFDLTEPDTSHFVANGFIVHNCSEYMFLDDTACNLASLNLMKFYDAETNQVDVEALKHATRLWTMVLEISVLMAQFPSAEIARRSYEYRTLGLGYANLGTLLMVAGIPYDSPRALAWTGAISALLTGESYAASAEMAADLGPFPRYKENSAHMLRVMRNHRRAAYNATAAEYEDVSVVPVGIDPSLCPSYLLSAARASWDRAVALGEKHGYRNAQATCIAPTGCLVGNSLVATDRGLMRLNKLGDMNGDRWQDADFSVLTDTGEERATKFYVNGVEPTRRITTRSGYRIQGTPTHRVKIVDPDSGQLVWKRFADIGPGDIVALSMGKLAGKPRPVSLPPLGEEYWTGDYTTRVPRMMSRELAEVVGYFMGDGSLHSKGLRFCVSQTDPDVIQRLSGRIRELFNLEANVSAKRGYWEVAVHSVPLAQWWEACRFTKLAPRSSHAGKGYVPRIPDAVLATNDAHIYGAFLRGLFEADGTVTNAVPSVSTSHETFAQEVRTMMLALGVPTKTQSTRSGWGSANLQVVRVRNRFHVMHFAQAIGFLGQRKSGLAKTNDSPQAMRKDHVHVAREIIRELAPVGSPFHAATHLSLNRNNAISRRSAIALLERTQDVRLQLASEFFYDTIAANEDGGEQLTYDVSVPSTLTYVAGGFISHNTIGLQMDCDTTGIEPDFALVKFKKLSGGGYFKIINQSIPMALRHLGYTEDQIEDVVRYANGSGSLYGAPYINVETLRARGFSSEDIVNVEKALPTVFEIGFAFNQYTLGEATLKRLGFTPAQYNDDFDLLRLLGFSREEIDAANNYICGTMTIEGAPHLKEEHYAVFDCANKCGKLGRRFIHHMGHVRMMAAAQPFISGAISKTINLPNEATVDEIKEAYMRSWDLGLKAIALYRDGSKLSQPLSNKSSDKDSSTDRQLALSEEFAKQLEEARRQRAEELRPDEILAAAQRILANATNTDFKRKVAQALERNRLPAKRRGWTQKAKIAGHTVFLRTGEYGDGTLGEIFIDMHKEGASFRSLMNCFAIAVSIGLQYGVPLEEFVDKFVFTRFEPNGFVDHPNIKHCTSVVDYIFRVLGMEYLARTDFVQIKPDDKDVDETHHEDHAQAEFEANVSAQQALDESRVVQPAKNPRSSAPASAPSAATAASRPAPRKVDPELAAQLNALRSREAQMASLMGDAPMCDMCGSMTRRNGTCYVCDSCGRSMGCS